MSYVWIILKHNLKWIAALTLIFAFASGVLSNASSLSQWYSKTLTTEFLATTRVDFVVNQEGLPEKMEDVRETIMGLNAVEGVISKMYVQLGFWRRIEFSDIDYSYSTSSYFVTILSSNGTKIVTYSISFCSFSGLNELIDENDIGASLPEQGEVVVSPGLARLLDRVVADNLTIETPYDVLTFEVVGITGLSYYTIMDKINKPDLPIKFSPSTLSGELKFNQTTSGELFCGNTGYSFAIVSPEDAAGMFDSDWITETMWSFINHYVYVDRESVIEPLNIDQTVSNLLFNKDRIELTASDVPVSVSSDILTLFEVAANEVNLFAVVAGGFMLAALPLYWFVASPLTNMFVERKRSEIALLRIRGLSIIRISLAYTILTSTSAILGGVLGALLQANILQIFATIHIIGLEHLELVGGPIIPDFGSLFLYVIISLFLAIFSVRRIIKTVASLQPIQAIRSRETVEKAPSKIGKFSLLLLGLGLVKIILQFAGVDSTVYFKYPPSNPFLSMGLALFATFDNYALTPLAPVFLAYGFAKLISTKSEKLAVLFQPFSFLAGLKKRKISLRLLSSEMWRTAASLVLITLIISYGVGSYINSSTVSDHAWKMAGEFTGADIRVDCFPNNTAEVEEAIRSLSQISNYTRIDVLVAGFMFHLGWNAHITPLFAIDPETYLEVAYLENAPELRDAIATLERGHIIVLKDAQKIIEESEEPAPSLIYDKADTPRTWSEIRHGRGETSTRNTMSFEIDSSFNISVPGTIESMETIKVKKHLEEDVLKYEYSVLYGVYESYVADALLPHTGGGALFDFGGLIITQEDASNIKHEHVKSMFIVKLRSGVDPNSVVAQLSSILPTESLGTTRSEAIGIITKGYPRLAVGLDFTEINSILITAISFGGLLAIGITTTAGRTSILCLLRIKGGKRKDGIALFLPETALVSFLACLLGIGIGLPLGTSFINSTSDLIPPLFTGNTVQIFLSPSIGYFTATVLAVFCVAQIVSIAVKSVIDLGAL
jgi:hypothetical protein